MNFMHSRKYLFYGDVVEVQCSHQCNIRLTTDLNFNYYKQGKPFKFYGGRFKRFPARIPAPDTGYWNITIDIGGDSAEIQCAIVVS